MMRGDRRIKAAGLVTVTGLVTAAALSLSACGEAVPPSVTVTVPDGIKVESVGEDPQAQERRVTVSAGETVNVVPDMARIVYRIVTEDKDAAACQEKNSRQLDQVVQYLKDRGYEDNSIKTTDFSLNTRYDWSGDRRVLAGYEMSTSLEVTDVLVEQVGELLTGAVNAGASEIWSVSYFSSRYDEAYGEALEKAMAMAREKAETLAHSENCQVTDVLGITEQGDDQSGRYVESGVSFAADAASQESGKSEAASADLAVMPGEMQVKAEIQVEYRLLPR